MSSPSGALLRYILLLAKLESFVILRRAKRPSAERIIRHSSQSEASLRAERIIHHSSQSEASLRAERVIRH